MRREEFLAELDFLLQDISAEEREEAMQYYRDYFHEAGEDQEEHIIEQLGSPAKVAAEVRTGLQGEAQETGEYRETGYADTRFEYREEVAPHESKEYSYEEKAFESAAKETKPETNKTLNTVLLIIIILAALPILGPILVGVVALVFGIVMAVLGIGVSLVVAAVAIGIVGIVVAVAGIFKIFTSAAAGLLVTGVGIILAVLGVALTVLLIKVCSIVFPAVIRGIVSLGKKIFRKEKAVA